MKLSAIQSPQTNTLEKLNDFITIFKTAGSKMRVRRNMCRARQSAGKQSDWWCRECEVAKQNKYKVLRRFRMTDTREDLQG